MASDVTKLQSVTISQLFKPEDKPECEWRGGSLGTPWGERQAGGASMGHARVGDTVLVHHALSPSTCLSARACTVCAKLLGAQSTAPGPRG
jgi:hypothetical protein